MSGSACPSLLLPRARLWLLLQQRMRRGVRRKLAVLLSSGRRPFTVSLSRCVDDVWRVNEGGLGVVGGIEEGGGCIPPTSKLGVVSLSISMCLLSPASLCGHLRQAPLHLLHPMHVVLGGGAGSAARICAVLAIPMCSQMGQPQGDLGML